MSRFSTTNCPNDFSVQSLSPKNTGDSFAALKTSFPLTLPVMAGYVFLGITYGILMVSQGLPP